MLWLYTRRFLKRLMLHCSWWSRPIYECYFWGFFFHNETALAGTLLCGLVYDTLLNYTGCICTERMLWVTAVIICEVGRDTNAWKQPIPSCPQKTCSSLPSLFLLQSRQSLNAKMLLQGKLILGIALFVDGHFGSTEGLDLPLSRNRVFFQLRHCLFGVSLLWIM